jgi:hypothetical protein
MPKTTALDSLIREVPSRQSPHKAPDEVIIPILLNPNRSFFEWKREIFFLVSKYRGTDCGTTVNVAVEDFSRGWRLDLVIEYRVRVADAPFEIAARKIAEELYDPDGPQHKMELIIKDWVQHCVSQMGGAHTFILEFFAQRHRVAESLRRWAQDRLYLDLKASVTLRTEKTIKETVEIPAFATKVVFKDYDHAVDLQVEMLSLDLLSDPAKSILAHIRDAESGRLREVIEKRLRDIIKEEVQLHQFRGNTTSSSAKHSLKTKLNEVVNEYGRTIRVLDLRCETPLFETEDFYRSPKFDFNVSVPEYPRIVIVNADIQMELENLGVFATAGVAKLDEWAREAIETCLVPRLSRHTYVKLIHVWEDEKSHIDEDLRQRAAAIGYKWIHSHITTDLPFDQVRKPFSVQLDETVATSHSESKVTLHLNATVKIDDVSVLARRYPTEINIETRVQEALRLVLQRAGKEHSPKDWYLNFDAHSDARATPIKTLVHQELQDALAAQFGGSLLSADLSRDGSLLEALNKLREQTPCFRIEVTRAHYQTELAYRVVDVFENLWHRFAATKPSIEQLNERIRLHVQQAFSDDDPALFRRRSNNEVIRLLNDGTKNNGLPLMIANQYGLKIYIDHWIREITSVESQEDQIRDQAEKVVLDEQEILLRARGTELQGDLGMLQEMKRRIRIEITNLHPKDDAEEIAQLEKRLQDLDERIRDQSSGALQDIVLKRSIESEHRLARSLGQEAEPKPKLIAEPSEEQDDDTRAAAGAA